MLHGRARGAGKGSGQRPRSRGRTAGACGPRPGGTAGPRVALVTRGAPVSELPRVAHRGSRAWPVPFGRVGFASHHACPLPPSAVPGPWALGKCGTCWLAVVQGSGVPWVGLGDGGRSGGGPPDACHARGACPGSSGSAPRGAHPASAGAPSALEWSRLWVGGPGWWLLAEVGTLRASLTEAADAGAPSSGGQAWEQRLLPAGLPFRPPIPCPPRVGGRAAVGHVHWSASLAAGPGAGPRGLARPRPDLCTAAPLWPGHRSG